MTDSFERLQKLKETLLQTEILAQFGGSLVSPEASDYVAGLIRQWYVITDDGEFQQTDQTPLRTSDLRPMEIDQVGDYLQTKHPYLFRESGTPGVSNAVTKEAPPPALNRAEMSIAERAAYIKTHGGAAYLALPETAAEARPLSEKRRSEMSPAERARLIRELGSAAYMDLPA